MRHRFDQLFIIIFIIINSFRFLLQPQERRILFPINFLQSPVFAILAYLINQIIDQDAAIIVTCPSYRLPY
jgi:hypothetical protein